DGAGIWGQGGLSIATEADGPVGYVVTGNSNTDTFTPMPGQGLSFAQSILRLGLNGSQAPPFSYMPRDYFGSPDYIWTSIVDTDLAGNSPLIIPDQEGTSTPRLLMTSGKDGRIYLLNRDNLGGNRGELQHLRAGQGFRTAPSYFKSDEITGGPF